MEVLLLLIMLLQAIACGLFCGYIAKEKGRGYGAWFALGFLFSLLAILALIALPKVESAPGAVGDSYPPRSPEPMVVPEAKPQSLFNGPRDLDLPAYQLFLTRRFDIERNNTLDKFVIGEQVFNTLAEALADADRHYGRRLEEQARQKQQQEQELQRRNEKLSQLKEQQRAYEKRLEEDRERARIAAITELETRKRNRRRALRTATPWVICATAGISIAGWTHFERERSAIQAGCDKGETPWLLKKTSDENILLQCGGLLWTGTDNGQDVDWIEAQSYCQSLGGGGGWSLPTVAQLQSLRQDDLKGVQCQGYICPVSSLFKLSSVWFWSSQREGSSDAVNVFLSSGSENSYSLVNKHSNRALCVRRP